MDMYITKRGDIVPVYEKLPEGWQILNGSLTNPIGYEWINNCKSRFPDLGGGFINGYRVALLKL